VHSVSGALLLNFVSKYSHCRSDSCAKRTMCCLTRVDVCRLACGNCWEQSSYADMNRYELIPLYEYPVRAVICWLPGPRTVTEIGSVPSQLKTCRLFRKKSSRFCRSVSKLCLRMLCHLQFYNRQLSSFFASFKLCPGLPNGLFPSGVLFIISPCVLNVPAITRESVMKAE
jgi:hypothetical protein